MKPRHISLCLAFLALPATADAAVFAREDFNYANGSLATNNGGFGWSGAWTNAAGVPTVATTKGVVNAVAGQEGARLISALQEPPAGGTKIVWVSFEGRQFTSLSGNSNSYGGLGLFRGNTEQLLIGKSWGGDYQWRAGTGGNLIGATTPVSTLATTTVIARITLVDGTATANDTLDVWLNPADTSSVSALGPAQITRTDADLSFDTLRIRGGSGAGGTESWEFDAIAAGDDLADVVSSDSDGDGMLDVWETTFGLVVGVNDAAGDLDTDGATNLQEFTNGSLPNTQDTDGDSLLDGVETKTGIWVSASDRGTDPTKQDSDNDGLYDDQENHSGVLVDVADPGTDPNKADTDADTHLDLFEAQRGSNPSDALSTPATGDLALIGSDDFSAYPDEPLGGQSGGSGFNFDNSTVNNAFIGHNPGNTSDWDFITSAPTISGGKLFTQNNGAKREFNGPGEGVVANGDEYTGAVNEAAAAKAVYFRADLTRGNGAEWSGISSYDFGTERLFFGVPGASGPSGYREFGIEESNVGTTFNATAPILAVANTTYTIVGKLDFANDLATLWVNPDLSKTEAENTPYLTRAYTGTNWCTAMRLGSGGTAACSWDQVVIAREWSAVGTYPGASNNTYGVWIGGYPAAGGAPGFGQDADGDGVSNGIEQVLGTNPTIPTPGLREVAQAGGAFKFRHSLTNSPVGDVTFAYEWSADLATWHASGATNPGGTTVTIGAATLIDAAAPLTDEIEVTATVTAGPAERLFLRIKGQN